jgi:hypothetical protein
VKVSNKLARSIHCRRMIGRCQMISTMSAKPDAARLGGIQCGLGSVGDHLALMLGYGGQDSRR